MMWTWWQRDELASVHTAPSGRWSRRARRTPPASQAAQALAHAEAGETEEALAQLHWLSDMGWDNVAVTAARA